MSDFSRFHTEVSHLKESLRKNFPSNWFTIALKLFRMKSFCILPSHWLLRKKNCLLPFHILVNYLLLQEHVYKIVLTKNLPFCKIKAIFKSTTHLSKSFRFQDKVPFNLRCCLQILVWYMQCYLLWRNMPTFKHNSWWAFRRFTFNRKKVEG